MVSTATLISPYPLRGQKIIHPKLCQFQGFAFQSFAVADAGFTSVMALNVYLTFYKRFTASRLRKLERYYVPCCYGIPLIIASALLLVKPYRVDHFYGNEILGCWISYKYGHWKIWFFFMPIWSAELPTTYMYVHVLYTIYTTKVDLA
ncbi:cyclic-AMP receptor-like protein [Drepanopeziza brunnea f. sp. 'multigermtubi' MB_m1]|uniref:Cyclic-AMP receptor-like protein n=1 Tax=Marssonina brunnea f. sp. multigermtubi (strain MB_m1) TaxID=1072389 RepID=K1Y6N3_MARBU|nr:cyclic-AMP receptor-like protein [Drepanopeziza brunnea f. sp. 'multigermtubi' MB_m1]EKD20859.1 cyclic-AMP receptor-like protein [Drepanopeziza brunnea f. sp. 'multigermtubi' MB_m1]